MDIKTLLLFHVHLQTYEYLMEFQEAYDYVMRVFDKLGIEQVKDINQKKTIISEKCFQVIDEKIPVNILIYKYYYWLEFGPAFFFYGCKFLIEFIDLGDQVTQVKIYGKESTSSPSLIRKHKVHDIYLILSRLRPPRYRKEDK